MKSSTRFHLLASAAALLLATTAAPVHAVIITFDDGSVAAGTTISNQYAGLGVTFAPGGGAIPGVINPASTTLGFATNTNVSLDTLMSGAAAPLSGLVLHNFSGWASEDGDPAITMTFSSAVTFLSMDLGSVAGSAGQAALFALNPATNTAITVGFEPATVNGTMTATGIPAGARTFVIVPGNYNDYVAVDNINFTVVPEPSTWAMMAGGLGLLLVGQRFRRASRLA